VATSAISAGVVNGLTLFYTPKLIGSDGVPMVGRLGVTHPAGAVRVRRAKVECSGPDVIWTGVLE
jgi:riboflavin biosynthesis pyrimidine reductase